MDCNGWLECDSNQRREGSMTRNGIAVCFPVHKASLILLSSLSALLACSGEKPAGELEQVPAAPSITPTAGRSNGGAIAAEHEDGQWIRPAKNYASTRFSGLSQ